MGYAAIVSRVEVRPHPNADRLAIGSVNGIQVIVGVDTPDGTLGVYFMSDGQLSEQFSTTNNLVRVKNADGTTSGGMFEDNRRVRAMNIRGVKSDGFWCEFDYLRRAGVSEQTIATLVEGNTFTELDGISICNKYVTPSTAQAILNREKNKPRESKVLSFPEHTDTQQYHYYKETIKPGSLIIITEKLHGTSMRFGNVPVRRNLSWLEKLAQRFGAKVQETEYQHVIGTRRVILGDNDKGGYYGNEEFRRNVVHGLVLKPNEILYGEIVGYTTDGRQIMPDHDATKVSKEFTKRYGSTMRYNYGARHGECRMYIYRITRDGVDLSHFQVIARCKELGVAYVPVLSVDMFITTDILDTMVAERIEGSSTLDTSHIREGVCIRVEDESGMRVFKAKSYEFKLMEGIIKSDENYTDMEETA